MARQWTLCFAVLVIACSGLAMPDPRRSGVDAVVDEDVMTNYLDRQHRPVKVPEGVPDWPQADVKFGEVAGVDVSPSGDVIVFHRGDHSWTEDLFDKSNVIPVKKRVSIPQKTIVRLDRKTGQVLHAFGDNQFYVPHGVTVDKEGNLWLTDVGAHQVYRIPKGQTETNLTLGEKFVPGNDDIHFCKPTDVAVASNGDFFVADGYCNARVLKFSPSGQLLGKFGMDTLGIEPESPYSFNIPHSLALIEELDIICVADRENQRVLCYNAGLGTSRLGQFNRTIVPEGDIGKVYGVAYDHNRQMVYVSALLSEEPVYDQQGYPYSPARAFTYDLSGRFLADWDFITPEEAEQGPSIRHDIAVSPDGSDVYLADVVQHSVHKFTTRPAANRQLFG